MAQPGRSQEGQERTPVAGAEVADELIRREVIYGDTDSIFIWLGRTHTNDEAHAVAVELVRDINVLLTRTLQGTGAGKLPRNRVRHTLHQVLHAHHPWLGCR